MCYCLRRCRGIVGGFTITVVAMIGSSAMAGAVGAGGLGDLAIRYGYQRFDTTVMVTVIALLIAIVTAVQLVGDRFVRRLAQARVMKAASCVERTQGYSRRS